MSNPLSVVAKVASTPDQAKIYVALLQAEGIPAYVEGGALADEFAMSQRLMNLGSVKVMVPASSLDKAKEILQPAEIDEDDLAAQAMSATGAVETPPAQRVQAQAKQPWSPVVWIALIATVVVAFRFLLA